MVVSLTGVPTGSYAHSRGKTNRSNRSTLASIPEDTSDIGLDVFRDMGISERARRAILSSV